MLAKIMAWIRSKNITTHAVGAFIVAFAVAYNSSAELRDYIGTLFAGYPVVITKLGLICTNIAAGVALWRNFAHSSSRAGKVAAAEAIMASPDAPSEAAVAAATTTNSSAIGKLPTIVIAMLVIPFLTGCPTASLQNAAQASRNAAIIVQGMETAEIAAHEQGLIPDADHRFIQREVLTLATLGKTTDSCIRSAGNVNGAAACIDAAVTTVDQLNADGALYLKSATAKQDFAIAMSSVKTVLLTVETTLNGKT